VSATETLTYYRRHGEVLQSIFAMASVTPYRFCPKCGAGLLTQLMEGQERLVCEGCGFVLYVNPRPTTCAVVVEGDRVMLVRRAVAPRRGCWDLPGGFLERGEHPAEGIKRELREETGLEIELLEALGFFLDAYPEPGETTLNLYYIARVIGGEPKPGSDVAEIRWFPRDALPPMEEIAFPNNRAALAAWLAGRRYVVEA
jgi:ADP-ribose pyrophosphatase YjhB (NUDIX family)